MQFVKSMKFHFDQPTIKKVFFLGTLILFVATVLLALNLGVLRLYIAGIDRHDLESLESRLVLPKGASALESYRRYYFLSRDHSLTGLYVLDSENPGIYPLLGWMVPVVNDGGCRIVNVRHNLKGLEPDVVFCNGIG